MLKHFELASTADELRKDLRKPPQSVILFLSELWKSEKRVIGAKNTCLTDSYAADLVHGVTGGKVITAKHFLLATGLQYNRIKESYRNNK